LLEPELIASARQGEPAGWEALVQQHQDAVFRLAYLLLGDADDAQDVAQEAFIRAFGALERFDATRPLRPWLLRITANLARNRRRALGRYVAALQRALRAEPPPPAAGSGGPVEQATVQHLQAQQLWQAVRRLPPPDQQVVYLRYFLEVPEAEMAAALGVAAGTVKSRLHRALQRLRGVIAADYPELQERWRA
jgi:RNA polymerase sigma-70 factor (ECF subfamily)